MGLVFYDVLYTVHVGQSSSPMAAMAYPVRRDLALPNDHGVVRDDPCDIRTEDRCHCFIMFYIRSKKNKKTGEPCQYSHIYKYCIYIYIYINIPYYITLLYIEHYRNQNELACVLFQLYH